MVGPLDVRAVDVGVHLWSPFRPGDSSEATPKIACDTLHSNSMVNSRSGKHFKIEGVENIVGGKMNIQRLPDNEGHIIKLVNLSVRTSRDGKLLRIKTDASGWNEVIVPLKVVSQGQEKCGVTKKAFSLLWQLSRDLSPRRAQWMRGNPNNGLLSHLSR